MGLHYTGIIQIKGGNNMDITLHEKDGKVHALMFSVPDAMSGVEGKFNQKAEEYLSYVQNEGYEIVDVKASTKIRSGCFAGYSVMVLYK